MTSTSDCHIEGARVVLEKSSSASKTGKELSSFGIYLGSFSRPLSAAHKSLLSQWDILIINPLADGAREAAHLSFSSAPTRRLIGRIDVSILPQIENIGENERTIQCLDQFFETFTSCLKSPCGDRLQSPFSGILLAGFRSPFQPAIVNQLAAWINGLGFDVWLELSAPEYLSEREADVINMNQVQGLVYRNATIRSDGDRQNFMQMEDFRRTMRTVAAQRAVPGPRLFLWETIDNDRVIDYAVVTRTYNWSIYNSALCWIGHADALSNATIAANPNEVVAEKPLGALRWLKDEHNMRAHEVWRGNERISTTSCVNEDTFALLADFVPELPSKLQLFPPQTLADEGQALAPRNGKANSTPLSDDPNSNYSSVPSLWKSQYSWAPSMHSGFDKMVMMAPLSSSASGEDFTGLGCFQLGHAATFADFTELRQAQRRLRDLDLLQRLRGDELADMYSSLSALFGKLDETTEPSLNPSTVQAIRDLVELLDDAVHASASENADDGSSQGQQQLLQVFCGLHSGFQGSPGLQFWGLYDIDTTGAAVIYLSNKTEKYRPGVILHTFLSSRQCSRTECFAAEIALAQVTGLKDEEWRLPFRFVEDVKNLSPTETLLLAQQLTVAEPESDEDSCSSAVFGNEDTKDEYRRLILSPIRHCCEYQLIEIPTVGQQRELNSTGYLSGQVSASQLVAARLSWLSRKGCWTPDAAAAEAVFKGVDAQLYDVLMLGQTDLLSRITSVVQRIFLPDKDKTIEVDAAADIFALAVFSAFRRYSLEEIYLEILDRNVYPNHTTDQAGCFAEYYALGARCEWFFDMTPRALGRILAGRYRVYYRQYQPERREIEFMELPTTYAAMQVDQDRSEKGEQLDFSYKFTFFGIFAVPALIDVSLLTTIGRGLYLTTFMSDTVKTLATTALMLALLISGSFGSWIGTGGCYYFYANAFPAMNMFVLTRFVAGFAFSLIIGVCGFLVVLFVSGFDITYALIFLFYFVMLSSYMLTLNAMAIYQLPGSSFLSGRTVIITCIPILFISPIVSIFTQHDIAVYIPVLAIFLISVMLGARSIVSHWSSWYLRIPSITDAEVIEWFRERTEKPEYKQNTSILALSDLSDSQLMPTARKELYTAVLTEHRRSFWMFWRRETGDALVARLAKGYAASMFLMRWYCRHKRAPMLLPYSATWNLTINAGIQNMTNMQKGLRLHSAFLHWRSTGHDIWAGFLYFVVALLDKWASLLTGGNFVGLSAAGSSDFRLGIGFGLCYYLIGAVSLDIVSQPLWIAANEQTDRPISSLENLKTVEDIDRRIRYSLYWRNLVRFFFVHVWGAAVVFALMWIFEDSRDQATMLLAYVGAYWGLLWYQYNKIFCGLKSAGPLAAGALVGLPLGLALRITMPQFAFTGVIPLAVATWTACIHSFFVAGIAHWPQSLSRRSQGKTIDESNIYNEGSTGADGKTISVYTASTLEPYSDLSQQTLSKIFESTCALLPEKRHLLDPTDPNTRNHISRLLTTEITAAELILLRDAFPSAASFVETTLANWVAGKTIVEVVASRDFAQQQEHNKMRAISRRCGDGQLQLFVVLTDIDIENFRRHNGGELKQITGRPKTRNSSRYWNSIVEAMVSATC